MHESNIREWNEDRVCYRKRQTNKNKNSRTSRALLPLLRFVHLVLIHDPAKILPLQRFIVYRGHQLRAHTSGGASAKPEVLDVCLGLWVSEGVSMILPDVGGHMK